jgi:hypothetical protein
LGCRRGRLDGRGDCGAGVGEVGDRDEGVAVDVERAGELGAPVGVGGEDDDTGPGAVAVLFDAGGVVAAVRVDLAGEGADVLGAEVDLYEGEVFPGAGGEDDEGVGADGVGVASGAGPGAPAHRLGLPHEQFGVVGAVGFDEADCDLGGGECVGCVLGCGVVVAAGFASLGAGEAEQAAPGGGGSVDVAGGAGPDATNAASEASQQPTVMKSGQSAP